MTPGKIVHIKTTKKQIAVMRFDRNSSELFVKLEGDKNDISDFKHFFFRIPKQKTEIPRNSLKCKNKASNTHISDEACPRLVVEEV